MAMIRAKVYATEKEARDAIALEDAHRGLPRTEPGIRRGVGIFAASITTTSSAEAIAAVGGGFAVPIEALTAPELDKTGARDVVRVETAIALATDPVAPLEPAPIAPLRGGIR